jgi:methyltransferase family protein
MDISDRIEQLDTSLFDGVEAQMTAGDKQTLLALHAVCREAYGEFCYLEIGSHLGGSLQTFVRDPACSAVISIDPRPTQQPDERWGSFTYSENSTARMIDNLAALPGADLTKLTTIERSTEAIEPAELPTRPQLSFVDGEHTNRATLRDAQFCAAAMHNEGCIVFHDAPIVHRALSVFTKECEDRGLPFAAMALPDRMFVVELGASRLLQIEPLATRTQKTYEAYLRALDDFDPHLTDYRRSVLRRLRRAVARRS